MDIENAIELTEYLRSTDRIGANERISAHVLCGGVSNRTVLVQRFDGTQWVIKQALEKLRVQVDWFSSPKRIEREALGMRWLAKLVPDSVARFVFEDPHNHLLAMEAVPQPFSTWKQVLLDGQIERELVQQFGWLLGTIHRRSAELADEIRTLFDDRQFFESLRLEPYYEYTSRVEPRSESFYQELIECTRRTRLTLVHGDYSPKNILVHQQRLILIDHEVIHFGDPAFDLGFSMAHLLSKAHSLAHCRTQLCASTIDFWLEYLHAVGSALWIDNLEDRAVRHSLACLLARARGRSPLEYLDLKARDRQASFALELIRNVPNSLAELVSRWQALCDK